MLIKVNEEKTVGLTLPSIMNILSIYYNQNITLELIIIILTWVISVESNCHWLSRDKPKRLYHMEVLLQLRIINNTM